MLDMQHMIDLSGERDMLALAFLLSPCIETHGKETRDMLALAFIL